MGLSEERLHADADVDTLHHCPSARSLLLYTEVDDE